MRSIETIFLVAFLALLGLGAWNLRHWLHGGGSNATAATPNAPTPSTAAKSNLHTAGSKRSLPSVSANEFLPPRSSPTPVDGPLPTRRLPDANEVKPGMRGAEIQSSFGEATARTTKAENGELAERYYYIDKEHNRVTVVNLQGGVVVSIESKGFLTLANHD